MDHENVTKDEADVIVTAMKDATDVKTQFQSSYAMKWVLVFKQNVDKMVAAGTSFVIVQALGEWTDRNAVMNVVGALENLAMTEWVSYGEDAKVQLFELMVPHLSDAGDSTDETLLSAMHFLTRRDPTAQQRLRDTPMVMQKLESLKGICIEEMYTQKVMKRLSALSPSGTMTKAAH